MILKFLNASLKRRVLLMFMVIGIMLIIDMFIINYHQNKIDQHSKALSIIYNNQSSIDQLSITANKIFKENEFDVKDELLLKSAEISQNINLLIKGGKVPNTKLSIKPIKGDLLNQIKNLQIDWREAISLLNIIHTAPIKVDSVLKETITKTAFIDSTFQEINQEVDRVILVPNPNIKNSLSQFQSHKKLLHRDLNALATSFISDFEIQKQQYDLVLIIVLMVNLSIVGLFLFLMISAVISPLGKIGYLTTEIANGEDVDIKYNKPDEIGEIVTSVKSLGNHLRQASDFVHQIGEGNLEVTLDGLDEEKNVQGSLAHALVGMQNKLKMVSKEDTIRNWTTQGIAKFADILRANNNDLKSLGDAILAELINYTEANIGCIYVPEESEESTQLQLIAFYAYDTKKHFNESVEFGEGIIGQTFIEKKTTYLVEIPEDYTYIKSGVGNSSPNSILVVPLKVNEDVYGVLEVASFKEFSKEQVEFIERVAETIASTIYNVKNAERTKKLLEDSQELTEQMRAQEEEMRQNMEELSATQEEVARKELQTSSAIEAFDKSIATAEFNEVGIINTANSVFSELFGKPKNSIVGQNISSIVETTNNESVERLINDIFENEKSLTDNLHLISKNASSSFITAHISPLKSGNALLICYPSNNPETSSAKVPLTDLEEELTQNLNMLELTQQTIDEKIKLIEHSLVYFEINSDNEIIAHNTKAIEILGTIDRKIIGEPFNNILIADKSNLEVIHEHINKCHSYSGIISIKGLNKTNKKIMLYIDQVKDKK